MSPKELFEKLKIDTTPKMQETLAVIYEVCEEQQKRGINDFSIATIAKLGFRRGVPKAQSLRNKSGEKYRALIVAFAEANVKKTNVKLTRSEEDWIDEIPNAKHKLLVKSLVSELKATKRQLDEIIPPNTRIDVYDHKASRPSESMRLTPQERRALEYLVSESFQKKWSLRTNEYGELIDSENQSVFKVATIDAIKKALGYL